MSSLSLNSVLTIGTSTNLSAVTSTRTSTINLSSLSCRAHTQRDVVVQPFVLNKPIDSSRRLTLDGTTQLQYSLPRVGEPSVWRLEWTGSGTAPGFRTRRSIGLAADSVVSITNLSSTYVRISTASGTALNTAAVQVGDVVFIERTTDAYTSPFLPVNQGVPMTVRAKGNGYVDVDSRDAITGEPTVALGAGFANALRIFSSDGAQVGDTLLARGTIVNAANRGKHDVLTVRDDYIEVTLSGGVAETISSISADIVVAEEVFTIASITSPGQVELRFDSQSSGVFLAPAGAEAAFYLASNEFYAISLYSTEDLPFTVSVEIAVVEPAQC